MNQQSVDKRFFYSGKEQRREAKEAYEEKCERKLLSAAREKPRWCPELEEWPLWVKRAAKDAPNNKKIYNRPNSYPGNKIFGNQLQPTLSPPSFGGYENQYSPNNFNNNPNFQQFKNPNEPATKFPFRTFQNKRSED
jgi:hypothetical protein